MREGHLQLCGWVDEEPLTEQQAEEYIAKACFSAGPTRQLGIELEWLVFNPANYAQSMSQARLNQVLDLMPDPMPGGGWTALEPGGQVEIASPPAPSLAQALISMSADLAALRETFHTAGLRLVGAGNDPLRDNPLIRADERYQTMENVVRARYGNRPNYMSNTASIQLNVDCGDDSDDWRGAMARWRFLYQLGPILTGAFANSPFEVGKATGWRSSRQRSRFDFFPEKSLPRLRRDPISDYVRFAMDSELYFIRTTEGPWVHGHGLTFRTWITEGAHRPPTLDDLKYHLSALFTPLKPRGYYELRMIDALDGDFWMVPPTVVMALLEDEQANAEALAALDALYADEDLLDVWLTAARRGLGDPTISKAALACFEAAYAALDRIGIPLNCRSTITEFIERYPTRGRCPADDYAGQPPESMLGLSMDPVTLAS